MTYGEAARKLQRLGCIEIPRRSGGSHRKWLNPATGRGAVLPDWGHRDLKKGTLHGAVKQLRVDWQRFEQA